MSFKAILKLEDREINIVNLEFDFNRNTNKNGYPDYHPQSGFISLFLETSGDNLFYDWGISNSQKKSGSIIFYKRDNQSKLKELVFTDAYCVFFREKFSSKGDLPFLTEIKLSAGELKYGNSVYRNPWFENAGRDGEEDQSASKIYPMQPEITKDVKSDLEQTENKSGNIITSGFVKERESLITKRESILNTLKLKHGPFDISNFKPQGIEIEKVPETLFNEMIEEYSDSIPNVDKRKYLNNLIHTGSTIPEKKEYLPGDSLYKIIPKGELVTPFSPFFMSKDQLLSLEKESNIEQTLGLPLISHSVEYDVYEIMALQKTNAFESTIAKTVENTYSTKGGAKQMLIINRGNWSPPQKLNTLLPKI